MQDSVTTWVMGSPLSSRLGVALARVAMAEQFQRFRRAVEFPAGCKPQCACTVGTVDGAPIREMDRTHAALNEKPVEADGTAGAQGVDLARDSRPGHLRSHR